MRRMLLLLAGLVLVLNSAALQSSAQTDLPKEMAEQKLTLEDFQTVTNFYYKKPKANTLLSVVKVVISQQEFLDDAQSAAAFAHFVATVARSNSFFLDSLKNLSDLSFGRGKDYLKLIIQETEAYKSPEADSPLNIEKLWGEFIATGQEAPVVKIMDVLAAPASEENGKLIEDAQFSLMFFSHLNPDIFNIVQQAYANASGLKKERLEKVVEASPTQVFAKYGFVDNKYFKEKVERLDKMVAENPEDAKNYLSRGITKANNHDFEGALPDFKKALELNPNMPIANNYICFIYLNQGFHSEAEGYCNKAIEQSPNFSKPYFNLARIYQYRKDYPKAIDSVSKAITYEPGSFEAYLLRAQLYEETGEYEKEIADLEKAKKINYREQERFEAIIERVKKKMQHQ